MTFDFALAFMLFFAWITYQSFASYNKSDAVEARIFCSFALVFLMPVFCIGRIFVGDTHVDDDGIGWHAWGKRWLFVKWSDVKAIKVTIIAAYNQIPPTQTIYSFYKTEKMPNFHLLRFSDQIPNAQALIDEVDKYVRQLNIPVYDFRGDGSAKRKPYFLWVPVNKTGVRRTTIK